MAALPLPLALPAATAALAYLNARIDLSYDLSLLRSLLTGTFATQWSQFRDRCNLFYALESHALSAKRRDDVFVVFENRSFTFAQTYTNALRYAGWLKREQGVRKGEVVAMDFSNREAFIWLWFAIWSLGAQPAFVNCHLTGEPLLHSARTSSAQLLLVEEGLREKYPEEVMTELSSPGFRNDGKGSVRVVFVDEKLEEEILHGEELRVEDEERGGPDLKDMAMLIYTSGTTGLPKAAVISWWKAIIGGAFVSTWVPLRKGDVMYTCMPLYHSSASILGVCAALFRGTTLAIGRRFSVHHFWDDVRASNATVIHYVGETCRYLLSAPPSPQDKQHRVRAAFGNGLRPDVWERFKTRFGIAEVAEFYASTEGPSGLWNKSRNGWAAGAIGRNGVLATIFLSHILSVVKVDVVSASPYRDPKTGLCVLAGWDEPGELIYRLDAKNIEKKFQGYFENRRATRSKVLRDVFKKGDAWFSTGDVLRWDRQGRWWFVDRLGDTFRWKSENVSTAEVAHVLGHHPAIKEANVYGVLVPNHDGRAGCAAIVLEESASPPAGSPAQPDEGAPAPVLSEDLLQDLASHTLASLPKYAVPLFLRVTHGFTTTGTNKQQKHALREQGVDPERWGPTGDRMFWLRGGRYVEFGEGEWRRILGSRVKL